MMNQPSVFEHVALPTFAAGSPLNDIVGTLAARQEWPRLTPKKPFSESLRKQLTSLPPARALGVEPRCLDDARAVLSGLLLWSDCLADSHTLSQQIETPTGSYWHGIMHRREPDFANSKYWFKRVGEHEAYHGLMKLAVDHLQDPVHQISGAANLVAAWLQHLRAKNRWDPFHFVDLCERHAREAAELELLCQMQELEIRLLLRHCARVATGLPTCM